MAKRRFKSGMSGIIAVILSLSMVFAFAACSNHGGRRDTDEDHIGRTRNSEKSKREGNEPDPTETVIPTNPDPTDTVEINYDYVKSVCVYSVWYDPTEDNPADYTSVAKDDAFALKGVFYFTTPLTASFEAKLYKDGQVILTKNIELDNDITAEADFSAGLEWSGVFDEGNYTVELLFEGKSVASTDVLEVY